MLGRSEIRNAAILKPQLNKQIYHAHKKRHAYTRMSKDSVQCIECGKIKIVKRFADVH